MIKVRVWMVNDSTFPPRTGNESLQRIQKSLWKSYVPVEEEELSTKSNYSKFIIICLYFVPLYL